MFKIQDSQWLHIIFLLNMQRGMRIYYILCSYFPLVSLTIVKWILIRITEASSTPVHSFPSAFHDPPPCCFQCITYQFNRKDLEAYAVCRSLKLPNWAKWKYRSDYWLQFITEIAMYLLALEPAITRAGYWKTINVSTKANLDTCQKNSVFTDSHYWHYCMYVFQITESLHNKHLYL